nr:MAG TPA: antirestriction protein [Caudoviricetes sp.]
MFVLWCSQWCSQFNKKGASPCRVAPFKTNI